MRPLPLTAALLAGFLSACSDPCRVDVIARASSPDARHDAVTFQRDCGATTGFSTQVSILAPGAQPDGAGNAFVADTDKGAAPAAAWGGPWAEATWLGPDRLLVRHAERARVFKRLEAVADVSVSYEQVSR